MRPSVSEIREALCPRVVASEVRGGFAEPVIGPAPPGRTRWLSPPYNRHCDGDCLLTYVPKTVTNASSNLAHGRAHSGCDLDAERVRCPRAVSQTVPGRLWATARPA